MPKIKQASNQWAELTHLEDRQLLDLKKGRTGNKPVPDCLYSRESHAACNTNPHPMALQSCSLWRSCLQRGNPALSPWLLTALPGRYQMTPVWGWTASQPLPEDHRCLPKAMWALGLAEEGDGSSQSNSLLWQPVPRADSISQAGSLGEPKWKHLGTTSSAFSKQNTSSYCQTTEKYFYYGLKNPTTKLHYTSTDLYSGE